MKKTVVILLTVFIVAAVVLFSVAEVKHQKEKQSVQKDSAAAYNEEIRTLWEKKRDLERDIQGIEQSVANAGNNLGSAVLLFAEPDLRLEEDVFPIMKEYGYTGVIALSLSDFDKDAQRLSDERLRELQSEGWELCLSLGATEDLAALCRTVRQTELKTPKTLYLPETLLTESQSEIAQLAGITTVVQHSGAVNGEICYALPCIMATGSRESLVSEEKKGLSQQLLMDAVGKSGGLVLTVGYNRVRDTFEENNFSAMLRNIDRYVQMGKLAVTDCGGAWERMTMATLSEEELETQNRERLADLRQQLDEVNERINQLAE